MKVGCADLGVADCDFIARGEAPREIVDPMVRHLEEEHGMDMPNPEVILDTYPDQDNFIQSLAQALTTKPDKETQLVIKRLRQKLNL